MRERLKKLETPLVFIMIAVMAYVYFTAGGGTVCLDALDCSY